MEVLYITVVVVFLFVEAGGSVSEGCKHAGRCPQYAGCWSGMYFFCMCCSSMHENLLKNIRKSTVGILLALRIFRKFVSSALDQQYD